MRGRNSRRGAAQPRRFHGVAHEHGDGHGANAARDGGERTGRIDGIGMNIADERGAFGAEFLEPLGKIAEEAFSFLCIRDAVRTHINHGGTRLDPAGFNEASLTHGGHDDVRAAGDFGKISRFRVANRNRGVGMHEQKRHGFAHDVTAAEDDGVGALELDFIAAKNFQAACRSAGDEAGASTDEAAEIDGMKAVDVLGGIDGFEDALRVDLGRKGKLDENSVEVIVAIQILDDGQQIESGDRGGRREERTGEADLFACGDFAFDVELRSGVFSDEDRGEARTNAGRREQTNFVFQFGENLIADLRAIEEACGHVVLAFDLSVRCERKS